MPSIRTVVGPLQHIEQHAAVLGDDIDKHLDNLVGLLVGIAHIIMIVIKRRSPRTSPFCNRADRILRLRFPLHLRCADAVSIHADAGALRISVHLLLTGPCVAFFEDRCQVFTGQWRDAEVNI